MKITCSKSDLISALNIVSKAADPKPQTPILSGVYLKAEEDTLELQANNYEIGLVAHIKAEVETEGTIVIPGRYFQEVSRRLPADTVTLELNETEMTVAITSGSANFKLRSMNANNYPTVHDIEGTLSFYIPNTILRNIIKKTAFACSNDEQRPVFTGCSLEVIGKTLTVAATNSHRLSVISQEFEEELGDIKIIIPSRIMNEVKQVMTSDVPNDVKITCSHTAVSFSFDNILMTSRLIEGQFPNFRSAIPSKTASKILLDVAAFKSAVDRVSLISRSSNYNIIKFLFEGDMLRITSDSPDIGKAEEVIPAQIEGPGLKIAFNAQYIIDVMKTIDTKTCRLSFGASPLAPATVQEYDNDDFIYVVTPVRTQN